MLTGIVEVAPGLELAYESLGSDDAPTVLLIAGLGQQLNFWPESFCAALVEVGLRVVRFDHRDVGLSSKVADGRGGFRERFAAASRGDPVDLAYTLDDLAEDTLGLLDALHVPFAHVVGASMGGSIAQLLAITHRDRVRSLTSIMASSGEAGYGQAQPEAMRALVAQGGRTRAEVVTQQVRLRRQFAGDAFDEAIAAAGAQVAYDRCFYPPGVGRHLLAAISAPDRAAGLRTVALPTLVVHGDADPLVNISGGRRLAELVPGARMLILPGTGHDVAERDSATIAAAVIQLVRGAERDHR